MPLRKDSENTAPPEPEAATAFLDSLSMVGSLAVTNAAALRSSSHVTAFLLSTRRLPERLTDMTEDLAL